MGPWSHLQTTFLTDLEAAGFARDSIDTVLCTTCTSTTSAGTPCWSTAPGPDVPQRPLPDRPRRVRTLAGRAASEPDIEKSYFHDSVKPVWDAGLVDLVATDHRVCDEINLEPTLGHTPATSPSASARRARTR